MNKRRGITLVVILISMVYILCVRYEMSRKRYFGIIDEIIDKKSKILDLGGGKGCGLSVYMRKKGNKHTVITCDIEKDKPGCRDLYIQYDGENLAGLFVGKRFDYLILCFVLHHVGGREKQKDLLIQAGRIADEIIIFEDHITGVLSKLHTGIHFLGFNQSPGMIRNVYDDETWREIIKEAGFTVIENRSIPGTISCPVKHSVYRIKKN